MGYYREFLINSVSIIVRKKEKPFYKRVFKNRLLGSGFVYFLAGSGIYTDKNGVKIPFKENDVLLVEYGAPYTIEGGNNELEYVTTAFSLDSGSSFAAFNLPTFFRANGDSLRLKVLALLKVWQNNSVYSRLESRLMINEIFLDIRKALDGETKMETSPVDSAVLYINMNYNRDISLSKLAELCNMSQSYFRSQFKEHKGISPLKYREEVRISWAKKYLKSNLLSVSEIAEKLGYCDIYHFSKAFKNSVGITISQYRQRKGII